MNERPGDGDDGDDREDYGLPCEVTPRLTVVFAAEIQEGTSAVVIRRDGVFAAVSRSAKVGIHRPNFRGSMIVARERKAPPFSAIS